MAKKVKNLTKEEGIALAQELKGKYPNLGTVEEVIDQARAEGILTTETNTLIVWGRLHRILPSRGN